MMAPELLTEAVLDLRVESMNADPNLYAVAFTYSFGVCS